MALALAACAGDGLWVEGEPGQETAIAVVVDTPRVRATVEGAGEGTFLVDTGAPFSVADVDSFPQLAPGVHRVDLAAFGLRFADYELLAYDALGGAPIDGLIGADLLCALPAVFDYRGGRAWLLDEPPATWPADVAAAEPIWVDVAVRGGGTYSAIGCPACGTVDRPPTRVIARVVIEGMPVAALVDTGASSLTLSEDLVARLGDGGRPRLDGVTVDTAQGPLPAYLTRVGRVEVSAATRTSVPALVIPGWDAFAALSAEAGERVDAIVGGSLLRYFAFAIDCAGRRIALGAYADTPHVDPREFIGPGFELAGGPGQWQIALVYPATDAAAKGLQVGDRVTELGGESLADADAAEIDAIVAAVDVGEPIAVTIDRAGSLETIDVLVEDLLPDFTTP